MTYAKIKDGEIESIGPRPNWLDDDGPVSDAYLAENGRLPILYSQPEYDRKSQRIEQLPQSEWIIESARVRVTYSLTEIPLEERRQALLDAVTNKRWQVETGGVLLPDGTHVFTGTDDQNRITSVIANAAAAGVQSVDFKAPSGWITLTIPEIQGVASVIALHVQACFTAERAHHEAIARLDAKGLADYDIGSGWPSVSDPASE